MALPENADDGGVVLLLPLLLQEEVWSLSKVVHRGRAVDPKNGSRVEHEFEHRERAPRGAKEAELESARDRRESEGELERVKVRLSRRRGTGRKKAEVVEERWKLHACSNSGKE